MTTAVTGTTTTSASTPRPVVPTNQIDRDAFLKLLVAQLRYQDPSAPTDPQQFIAQTAQFTTVERLEEISAELRSASRSSQVGAATTLLGREVDFVLDDGSVGTGRVTAVHPADDGAVITVGSTEVPFGSVTAIR